MQLIVIDVFGKIQPGKNPLVKFPQENCQLEIYPLGNFPGEYFSSGI